MNNECKEITFKLKKEKLINNIKRNLNLKNLEFKGDLENLDIDKLVDLNDLIKPNNE